MTLPRSLDEIDETELQAELTRRHRAQAKGICDYCGRDRKTSPCRFPKRHKRRIKNVKRKTSRPKADWYPGKYVAGE